MYNNIHRNNEMVVFIFQCLFFSGFQKGYFVMTEECNNCYIGSTLQPSPCPECCCSRDVPNTKNCCYKVSTNNANDQNDNSFMQSVPLYFIAALASLVFVTVIMTCCFKLADQKCFHFWRRKSRRNRRSSHDRDAPPAYDNLAMIDIDIQNNVLESPPYVKDPPSYLEATCNPSDLPEINSDNG